MDGLRTRALSGENAGRGTYAADHVGGGAGKPGVHHGEWDGHDRSFWGLSVCVDLTFGAVFGVCGLCRRARLIACAGIGSTGSGWGRGFWLGMASVQRLCEECEEWVTFLYEKMNVTIGVSDVGNHERV